MDVQPLLVLHIVRVKSWYVISMEKNKTIQKTGVEFTEIYAPDNTNTELLNRQTLWNQVEKAERRKDALLAREFEIAFPSELNAEQRKNMLNELCQDLVKNTVSSLTLLFMHLIQVTEVMNAITMHTSCSPPEVLMSMVTFQQKNIETSVVTMAQKR